MHSLNLSVISLNVSDMVWWVDVPQSTLSSLDGNIFEGPPSNSPFPCVYLKFRDLIMDVLSCSRVHL